MKRATDQSYPPHLLCGLLSAALGGDAAEAKRRAAEIEKRGLGVPLTLRWAKMVSEGEGPFARGKKK